MHTVAIIQARMNSSRLPGKVLMPLVGKPILWHITHRLRKCKVLDEIIIATSTNPSDDPIEDFALRENIRVIRGPEDNVLLRYAIAAETVNAEIIIRVTGDAPLVDPDIIDNMVKKLIEEQTDFCTGDPLVPCIHEGFSPFTYRALQKMLTEASDDPVAREHVTAYFKENPGFVPVTYISIPPDQQFIGARISVDTPADLVFMEEVYARLGASAGDANISDLVNLLRSDPDLLKINEHVHQKSANEKSRRVLIRCDGDQSMGLGHVVRCLALAEEFRERHGCGVVFAMASGTIGFTMVKNAGYPIQQKGEESESVWLEHTVQQVKPDVLILDIRSNLEIDCIRKIKNERTLIVTIDEPSERRLAADLAFYPPVPQVNKMEWTGFVGQLYIGWEWIILRREFAKRVHRITRERPIVIVTMGGSDPAGLTLQAIKALDLMEENFETLVILGTGFRHNSELEVLLASTSRKFIVLRSVVDMYSLMNKADLAIASFGVTAYELTAAGVPTIYLCLTKDHEESASILVEAGVACSMGLYTEISTSQLVRVASDLLKNISRRNKMEEHSLLLLDGKGAYRITDLVMGRLKN